jgi:folate-binding protein YgfZ
MSWLHTITTAQLTDAVTSAQTLVLSPQGHIQHDLHLIHHDDVVYLITESGGVPALIKYLEMMKFMSKVEIADASPDWAVVGAPGWIETSSPTWHSPDAFLGILPVDYVAHRPHSWQVSEYLVPRQDLPAHIADSPAGSWAWEALRIRAGVPRLGFEIDHRTIPHEVGLIASSVALDKGCYRGQETVARVYNIGKPPRRLVQLELDGSTNTLPERGTEVLFDGEVVGALTSVTQDFEHGPLALAVIRGSVPFDAVLRASDVTASQTVIVEPGSRTERRV